jgi:hypothetical protein
MGVGAQGGGLAGDADHGEGARFAKERAQRDRLAGKAVEAIDPIVRGTFKGPAAATFTSVSHADVRER